MNNKFLDLAGLQILVDKIKSTITSAVSAAEIKSAEYDNAGKISLAKGDSTKVDVSIPLASSLTGSQSGLLTKDEYTALTNKVEYVGTKVGDEVTIAAPLQKVGDYNNVAVVELLGSITASENSKAVTGKAVADYVATQIEANASSDKEYVDNTVSGAVDTLTKAYKAADNELSEALTTAYTNAIASSAANIKSNYEAADAAITSAYTKLVSETKEALQSEIDSDVNAFKATLKKEDAEVAGEYVSAVSQTDGVITVSRKALPVYTLVKDTTSANGYKYHLAVDGVQSGDAIDIKDMVVSGGSVSTHEDGKIYLDLTIANGETVSIPADSLVDTYKAGDDRIIVDGYTISLDLAKLTEDLVADDAMLAKFATAENLGKANTAISNLEAKHDEFANAVADTYATKDEAIGSLTELAFTGAVDTDSYYASFSAKDVNGNVHSTITFNLATKTEIESLF